MAGFDYRIYRFWFVRLVDSSKLGWLRGALVVALAPYICALVVVTPFGKAGLYFRTPAFYIGYAGIALVLAAAVRGVAILADGLTELQGVASEPDEFRAYVDETLTTAASDRSNIGYLGVCAAGGVALVAAALHRWHHTGVIDAGSHFHAFPLAWRAPDALVPAGLALAVFAAAVVVTFGSSLILLVRNISFVWHLRTFEYLPFPGRVRLSIRPLITAYTWVSATWMAGVALFVLFFFQEWSVLNIVGITFLVVIGGLTFAVPYQSFREILDDTHEGMASLLCQTIETQIHDGSLQVSSLAGFTAVNTALNEDPPPVLTRRGALAYGVVQVLAITGILTREVVQEQVAMLANNSSQQNKK